MRDAIRMMAREFNREGMTGAKDPGIGRSLTYDFDNAMDTWNAYREVLADGDLSVRDIGIVANTRNAERGTETDRAYRSFQQAL